MKIYISVDIEGISTVVSNDLQCFPKGHLYTAACKQMTRDVNAAIEGALEAGATEIVVNDAHGNQMNIIPDLLHEEAELIYGIKKPQGMMAGIDESFDGAMFIGYHAKSNSPGVICHTVSGIIDNLWINGELYGESAFNALRASVFNVPVIMVTGDDIVCMEAKEVLGDSVTTVQVKKAISTYSAQCPHPNKTIKLIKEGAKQAVKNIKNCLPLEVSTPCKAKIQFVRTIHAQTASKYPGSVMDSFDTVSFSCDTPNELINALLGILKFAY